MLHHPTAYAIYWLPSTGQPSSSFEEGFPAGFEATIDQFMQRVAGASPLTNVFSVDLLYGDGASAGEYAWSYGGSMVDKAPLPARDTTTKEDCPIASEAEVKKEKEGKPGLPPEGEPCITDAQIQAQLQTFIAAEKLPTGLGALYFVITPRGINSCAGGSGEKAECTTNVYCAYHYDVASSNPHIVYANLPFGDRSGCATPDQPNGNAGDDEVDLMNHEGNESITDPLVGEGGENAAWLDYQGEEVADKCTYPFFEPGIDFDQEIDAYGTLLGGAIAKYAEVEEEGETFLALTKVGTAYNQEIDGGHYLIQREWSNAAGGCVTRAPVPSASFTLSNTSPVAGSAVTFDGLSSSPTAGEIVQYEWSFGDDSPAVIGSQAEPSHTYSTAGNYTVTLKVTNDSGASASTIQQIVVSPVPTTTSATTTTTITVTTSAPVAHYSLAELASLLGLPHNGAKLSGAGEISVGHASCPVACGVKARLFALTGAGKHHKRIQIGSLSMAIARKSAEAISLSLTGPGKKMLRKGRRLATVLVVTVEDTSGASWTIERHLTLTSGAKSARNRSHAARRRRR